MAWCADLTDSPTMTFEGTQGGVDSAGYMVPEPAGGVVDKKCVDIWGNLKQGI